MLTPENLIRALVPDLPSIADAIATHGNAVFSFSAGRPIRAEKLPLLQQGYAGP
ncbi:hypothetical protein [Microlunatus parietis]|uniref:Uncharacterized protein n=1 Tax=Microlunatus parietis TaxID=682979 RepID=A0A7Y9I3T9_9ACTN|nr:hypothetical protein [Microlunatus parietis]NYE69714.1 hypothetical protein [Microlunatus parietis]